MTSIAGKLNSLVEDDARAALANCCAAEKWVSGMLSARPFASDDAVFAAARGASVVQTDRQTLALHVCLAAWWRARGVVPDLLVGHSIGELSAAVLAGVWSVADGARLAA